MKYVKKDVEQLIKTNIGVKIRKLKLCGRIDSESTNKILLFYVIFLHKKREDFLILLSF